MSRSSSCMQQAAVLGLLLAAPSGQSAWADENPAQPAAAAVESSRDEHARRPQVRTYTSVTVVNDPTQIPRLPSRVPPATADRPKREDRADIGRDRARPEAMRELRQEVRQELREVRRELHEPERPAEQRPANANPNAGQREANRPAATERQERRIERIEREVERLHERAGQAQHK